MAKTTAPKSPGVATLQAGTISLELGRLPPPAISGFASDCAVVDHEWFFEFHFFQKSGDSPPVSVLRIAIPIDDLATSVWHSVSDFYTTTLAELVKRKIQFHSVSGAGPSSAHPMFAADVLRVSRSGLTASIEFFFMPPRDVHLLRTEKLPFKPIPVGNVVLPTTLITGLLASIERVRGELLSRIGLKQQ